MVFGRDISDTLPGPSMQLQNGQMDPGEEYSAKNSVRTQNLESLKRSLQLYIQLHHREKNPNFFLAVQIFWLQYLGKNLAQ